MPFVEKTRYTKRKTCRSCGSFKLQPVLSLGNLYVSGFVDSPAEAEKCPRAPLELVLCPECCLLQLLHTVRPELLYRQYWYRSMVNDSMRAALADIAHSLERRAGLRKGDFVLDIGCNDGTLLRSYRTRGLRLAGFEPARNLLKEARRGATRIFNDFFRADPFLAWAGKKAKGITSIAMFYDLENPAEFVADIARCLHPDGIWVIQMSYLPSMLKANAFDNICHEHLTYYSLGSLRDLLERFGLKIFDVELNDVNGGSFRIWVRHAGPSRAKREEAGLKRVGALERYERRSRLKEIRTYRAFASRVTALKEKTVRFIRRETELGKRVYAYGASTKGNTLLQYYGLDHTLIRAAAERSPQKWGRKTIGTWIPIISEERMRQEAPDYLLILPWHFLREFTRRESDYLASGGKFVVPLPRFQVKAGKARRVSSFLRRGKAGPPPSSRRPP